MNEIEKYSQKIFENIKRVQKNGLEYWLARDLQEVLGYTEWRNFKLVIEKAKVACENSGEELKNHFVDVNKMVDIGSGTEREIEDVALTRYACYLIVQNGDPRKEIIALGQTYFAVQTRQQEIAEGYGELTEDQKRMAIRRELKEHNKSLAEAARNAGVVEPFEFAMFQNEGYKGLYGGLAKQDIAKRKNLEKGQEILDHMESTELAANLFRATQTDEKLRRDNIKSKKEANKTHYNIGQKVRATIEEIGGTMPEDLPTPEKSILQLEKENKKKLK